MRQTILEAIPLALTQAISVGIGLFIAFIGLVDAGLVTTPKRPRSRRSSARPGG